ncbi:hypothetical protein [Longispora albida]|uniref:hypothetical protein n=1 Tax=Longispora albida TaxID=203523 RepID=UPI00036DB2A9|nr:hypothetical protein [Longispora albida]
MTADIRLVPTSELDAEKIFAELFTEHWPEFVFHDLGVKPYVARRAEYFGDLDCFLLDGDRVVGAGWGVPLRWDGTISDLPSGYTGALGRSVEGHEAGVVPDTFVVMGGMVRADEQGKGWASAVVAALRDLAVSRGWERVIAPVRPTRKSTYPLTPIEEYATWRRPDGLPFDPWLRTHERMGATILAPAPDSQVMTGTVSEWESWTGLALPGSGDYVIPDGLSVLHVDREADTGVYREPNVWMRHR